MLVTIFHLTHEIFSTLLIMSFAISWTFVPLCAFFLFLLKFHLQYFTAHLKIATKLRRMHVTHFGTFFE